MKVKTQIIVGNKVFTEEGVDGTPILLLETRKDEIDFLLEVHKALVQAGAFAVPTIKLSRKLSEVPHGTN